MALIPTEGLPKMAICEPASIEVEPGKIYSWCSCGLTEKEPFCDSSHKNIDPPTGGFRSVKVKFDKAQVILFCQCKQTKTPPFCDDTHKTI